MYYYFVGFLVALLFWVLTCGSVGRMRFPSPQELDFLDQLIQQELGLMQVKVDHFDLGLKLESEYDILVPPNAEAASGFEHVVEQWMVPPVCPCAVFQANPGDLLFFVEVSEMGSQLKPDLGLELAAQHFQPGRHVWFWPQPKTPTVAASASDRLFQRVAETQGNQTSQESPEKNKTSTNVTVSYKFEC